MLAIINRILDWFKSLFWKEEMELTLVGLQYSGKTTFVNVIAVINYNMLFFSFISVVVTIKTDLCLLRLDMMDLSSMIKRDVEFEIFFLCENRNND